MGNRLEGKSAVVTGAGRGIGREIALALAREGASVVVNDPGVEKDGTGGDVGIADKVVTVIQGAGGSAVANHDSVASFEAAENIVSTAVRCFGKLDILVNVAGILRERMIYNMSESEWDDVIAVHLKGTFNCSRHACAVMKQQRSGRIINIVSDAWRGAVGQCNYSAAKGGIVSLTRSAARDMGRYGVTVNAVAPLASTRLTLDEKARAGFVKRYEAGLIGKETLNAALNMSGPEGVPPIILFLASDKAANINGQVFHAESGRISLYSEPVETKTIFKREGLFTLEELEELVPKTLAAGLANPAPAEPRE